MKGDPVRINLNPRAIRRAGATAAVAAMLLAFGACGGGSSDSSSDTTDTSDVSSSSTPPPTFSADSEAKFLQASKDPRAGKLADIDDPTKLEAGRAACADLKSGSTGKEVYDVLRKELKSTDVKDEELGFFIGTAVGAMCPEQADQLKKGF